MKASEYFKESESAWVGVFTMLIEAIGKTPDDIDIGSPPYRWPYDQYEWTEKEEAAFEKKLVDYVYKNRRALGLGITTKRRIKNHEVPFWMLCYSWKYKQEKDQEKDNE